MKKQQQESGSDVKISPALRRYLYVTAAVTGGAIMIIEILGAKMLAPYVGTSHFVWTAQIAVTLCALAVGYYAGGRMVDRVRDLGRLYGCIIIAAAYLCASSLIVKPVAYACLSLKLALGSLLASTVLFFVPIALLAMTGPFLARVITTTLSHVGQTVGRLTSIGTIGSVIGTVLIGYVLVPYLPNSYTMFFTAGLLLFTATGYFLVWNKNIKKIPTVLAGIVAVFSCIFTGVQSEQATARGNMTEIFRHNSNFGLLQVFGDREGTRRLYMNDFLMQNTYDLRRQKSLSTFTYMLTKSGLFSASAWASALFPCNLSMKARRSMSWKSTRRSFPWPGGISGASPAGSTLSWATDAFSSTARTTATTRSSWTHFWATRYRPTL
jgi:hypothetical protein